MLPQRLGVSSSRDETRNTLSHPTDHRQPPSTTSSATMLVAGATKPRPSFTVELPSPPSCHYYCLHRSCDATRVVTAAVTVRVLPFLSLARATPTVRLAGFRCHRTRVADPRRVFLSHHHSVATIEPVAPNSLFFLS
ncbi:hypothetical protein V8G54_010411 [Vigna mungo]|uniref:Uncharacterized protein n=1 Tax=Vigna mungo TaxID=3915 RepID=A0AAQ3NWM2_VIGMU